ncbi:T3SS effector HopA1 family protein [Rothia sp. 88186D007BW]
MTLVTESRFPGFTESLIEVQQRVDIDLSRLKARVDGERTQATSLLELKSQLGALIYAHFHLQNPKTSGVSLHDSQDLSQALIDCIPHQNHYQLADFLSSSRQEGLTRIQIMGLKVSLPSYLVENTNLPGKVRVTLPSWRRNTTPGYLLALSEQPLQIMTHDSLVRLYIGCDTAEKALETWKNTLEILSLLGANYQVKALSARASYPRSDGIVVYIADKDRDHVVTALNELEVIATANDNQEYSLFAQPVGPNIAIAAEPNDTRSTYQGLSFGQHRSRVLVDALLNAACTHQTLQECWNQETLSAGIDATFPAFNSV